MKTSRLYNEAHREEQKAYAAEKRKETTRVIR